MPKRIAAKDEVIWMAWSQRWLPWTFGWSREEVIEKCAGLDHAAYSVRRVRISEVTPNKRKGVNRGETDKTQ